MNFSVDYVQRLPEWIRYAVTSVTYGYIVHVRNLAQKNSNYLENWKKLIIVQSVLLKYSHSMNKATKILYA